jgi:hypothetical protein
MMKGVESLAGELYSTDIIMRALLEQRKERLKEQQRRYRSRRKAALAPKDNVSTTVSTQSREETENSTQREV